MRYFTLDWGAAGGGWTPLLPPDLILQALERSPFLPFTAATRMDLNFLNRWQSYNHDEAVAALRRGKEPTLRIHIQEPDQDDETLISYVSPGVIRSAARWNVDEERMRGKDPEEILKWLRLVAGCWPHFTDGSAEGAFDMRRFTAQHQLPSPPKPLMLGWAHLLTPDVVAYNYESIDVFLQAPAYRVRQLEENGLIELVVYADPLGYDEPESQQHIIEVTRYLDAHRHERFRRPPE